MRLNSFLELDRGTMTTRRFASKIQAYIAYRESGGYEHRYNAHGFRVLTVAIGSERLAHLKRVAEQFGGTRWFWFGLLSELDAEDILSASVWQRAWLEGRYALIDPTQRP